MKKITLLTIVILTTLFLCCCSPLKKQDILKEVPASDAEKLEELIASGEDIISIPYYELKDGTFFAQSQNYKEMFRVSGKLNNSELETGYIILSNIGAISFDKAWKASGLSSNSDDYYNENDVLFVGFYFPE